MACNSLAQIIICKFTAVKASRFARQAWRRLKFSLYKVRVYFPEVTAKSFYFSWRERALPAPSVCCAFDLYWLLNLCFSSPFLSSKVQKLRDRKLSQLELSTGFSQLILLPIQTVLTWVSSSTILRQKAVQNGLQSLCCCKTSATLLVTLLIRCPVLASDRLNVPLWANLLHWWLILGVPKGMKS